MKAWDHRRATRGATGCGAHPLLAKKAFQPSSSKGPTHEAGNGYGGGSGKAGFCKVRSAIQASSSIVSPNVAQARAWCLSRVAHAGEQCAINPQSGQACTDAGVTAADWVLGWPQT